MAKYIGEKKIKKMVKDVGKTHGGVPLLRVEFKDGTAEIYSKLMYDAMVSNKPCDPSKLREKRVFPVVELSLALLRDWGITVGETAYFSAILNQSLNNNLDEAVKELWATHMPRPLSLDDVSMVTIDRVLRDKNILMEDLNGK